VTGHTALGGSLGDVLTEYNTYKFTTMHTYNTGIPYNKILWRNYIKCKSLYAIIWYYHVCICQFDNDYGNDSAIQWIDWNLSSFMSMHVQCTSTLNIITYVHNIGMCTQQHK